MEDEVKELKPLNKPQQVFVTEYLKRFNATEAYLIAYPKSKRDSARANAARMIAEDSIKAEITARLAEHHMTADEALQRLADMARHKWLALLSLLIVLSPFCCGVVYAFSQVTSKAVKHKIPLARNGKAELPQAESAVKVYLER